MKGNLGTLSYFMDIQQQKAKQMSYGLFLSVAEEIKLPFLQIARLAEASQSLATDPAYKDIESTAQSALRLVDNYILGLRLNLMPQAISLENVSVSSVLYNTQQQLDSFAKTYDVSLDLVVAGKFGPVVANEQALQAALVSLGAALIEALPSINTGQLKLQLATHRSRYGIVAGIYADTRQISQTTLKAGHKLASISRQPLVDLSHTSGAGVFVASSILEAMDLKLGFSRHNNWYGLATILQPSRQLQLVP